MPLAASKTSNFRNAFIYSKPILFGEVDYKRHNYLGEHIQLSLLDCQWGEKPPDDAGKKP